MEHKNKLQYKLFYLFPSNLVENDKYMERVGYFHFPDVSFSYTILVVLLYFCSLGQVVRKRISFDQFNPRIT